MSKLVFVDTETTGLDSGRHEIWELAAIVRGDDGDREYAWQIRPSLKTADPAGLRVGRYCERCTITGQPVDAAVTLAHPEHRDSWSGWGHHVAEQLAPLLDGATLVGAVPDFDARFLTRFLRTHEQAATWHYHLVDVETLAAGALRMPPPWGFDDLLAAFGLVYDEADRHTALGDARMVRDLYDAVLAGHRAGALDRARNWEVEA